MDRNAIAAGGEPEGALAPGATIAPVPAWVDFAPLTRPETADPNFVQNGVCVLLEDGQVDLSGPVPADFYRRADMLVDVGGAQQAATFEVEYDPQHERLEVHFVRLHRGDAVLDRAVPEDFEVMRRERNLEARRFDGRLTVHLQIPDVRVGDIVETAYTVYGEPVAVAGRFSAWRGFEWSRGGHVETRYRVRAPNTRTIAQRTYGGDPADYVETEADGLVDRRWSVRERPGKRFEPLAPAWVVQLTRLQLSEWSDWSEIARRFTPYYEEDAPLPAELEAKVAEVAALATPELRAAALLRFVQNDIRYVAISMGPGGLIPRSLETIWETRYGDCKDVTKLFVTLARRVGLDACPAIVNTSYGEGVDAFLPSPNAFDHAMVRVRIGAKTYWLDATMPPQPSPLDALMQPRFGWALPLAGDARGLEHMGKEPFLTTRESEETVTLPPRLGDPAILEWTIRYRGWRGEGLRADIARHGEVGHFRSREEQLHSVWPEAKILERSVEDNVDENALTVRMRCEIPTAWEEGDDRVARFRTADITLGAVFAPLDPGALKHPIFLGAIGRLARTVTLRLPVDWSGAGWTKQAMDASAGVEVALSVTGARELRLEQQVKIRELTMPAESADRYREMVELLGAKDIVLVTRADKKGKILRPGASASRPVPWRWIVYAAVIGGAALRFAAHVAGN